MSSTTQIGLFSHIRGDVLGGLTAGIVALPLALAFGEQTEMGAVAGLYGAIALGLLAAIFGGTATQISGPTAPMTVVSAGLIAEMIQVQGGDLAAALPIILAAFFMAGILQVLLGMMRAGRLIKYIPHPVVSGFMSGIGIIIVITQIFPLIGAQAPAGAASGTLLALPDIGDVLLLGPAILGVATIAVVYLAPKLLKGIPGSLVGLVMVSAAAFFLFPEGEILRINSEGPIPSGLPKLQFGLFAALVSVPNLLLTLKYGATLALLGAIDSLLTSVVADNITKTSHSSDRELIGQGIGNMASALVAGLPGAGATVRTVINVQSGGRTRISGLIAGLVLLAVLLGLGKLCGWIPKPVLAGILVTVGLGIIDYRTLRSIRIMPLAEVAVMFTVLLLTVFVGLLEAVGVGMVLALLLFMKKIADLTEDETVLEELKDYAGEVQWVDEKDLRSRVGDRVFIKHMKGPLFFGVTSSFTGLIRSISDIDVVVIRMKEVPFVDQSGVYAMEDAIMELNKVGIAVFFTGLQEQPRSAFESFKLLGGLIPHDHCFQDFESLAQFLEQYLQKHGSLELLDNEQHLEQF